MVNSDDTPSYFRWKGVVRSGTAVGQRCVVKSKYNPAAFAGFLEAHGVESEWPVGREVVHARAHSVDGRECIDLSVQRESVSPEDLALTQEALKKAREHLRSAIWSRYESEAILLVAEEYAFVELPKWLKNSFTAKVAAVVLRTFGVNPQTVVVANGTLSFGPEDEGSLDALRRLLAEQYQAARGGERLDRTERGSVMAVAWILVALLLGTWFLKLGAMALLGAGIAMTIPIGYLAWKASAIGWRLCLLRPGAVTAIALYFISLFGLAYGVCAIYATKSEALGNSFLIATSMGLAGGVVGENLTGAALRVAHVQLLLFLGGLSMLVARVLRIDARLRDQAF